MKRHERNNDFLDFCKTFDILGLLETWAKSVHQYSTLLEGFKAHCTVRSKENNYSGGIIVYVKDNTAKGCKRILPHLRDVIVLQLSKSFFELERDIVLIYTYIFPEKSKVYEENESGIELFERKLHEILEKCTEEIDLLLLGDFFVRSARELDHLEDQGANDNITEDIYEHDGFNLPRNNKDTETNNYRE